MPFIITNGSSYCHKTRTQAVEIVDDSSAATRFSSRASAEKLLQRATKKLKGYEIRELSSNGKASAEPAQVPAENTSAPAKRRGRPRKNAPSSAVSTPGSAEAATTAAKEEPQAPQNPAENGTKRTNERRKRERLKRTAPKPAVEALPAPESVEESAPKPEAAAESAKQPEAVEEAMQQPETPVEAVQQPETPEEPAKQPETPVEAVQQPEVPVEPAKQPEAPVEPAKQPETPVEPAKQPEKPVKPAKQPEVKQGRRAFPVLRDITTASASLWGDDPIVTPSFKKKQHPRQEDPAKAEPGNTAIPAKAEPVDTAIPSKSEAPAAEPSAPEKPEHSEQELPAQGRRSNRRRNGRGRGQNTQTNPSQEMRQSGEPAQPIVPADQAPEESSAAALPKRTDTRQGTGKVRPGGRRISKVTGNLRSSGSDGESSQTKRRFFTTKERNLIYNRSEGHCGICGRFIPLEEYTIDHIIPLSKGGTNDLDNLQACCGFCNKAKDDSMGEEFFNRIERIFLYQAKLRYGKKQFKQLKKTLKELNDIS